MRCAYDVGVLTAFIEEYGFTEPDIVIAASGSVGPATYYLSDQYRKAVSWLSAFSGRHVISFRRRKVLDIDYVIDEVFKKMNPIDFEKLRGKKTRLFYVATRISDGETVYLEPPRDEGIYEYMRAAKAVPLAYGHLIPLGDDRYVDGNFGASMPDLLTEAIRLEATDIIVIENDPDKSSKHMFYTLLIEAIRADAELLREKGLERAARRELKEHAMPALPPETRVISIAPSKKIRLSIITRNKSDLRIAFNLGYADAADNAELRKLLAPETP